MFLLYYLFLVTSNAVQGNYPKEEFTIETFLLNFFLLIIQQVLTSLFPFYVSVLKKLHSQGAKLLRS